MWRRSTSHRRHHRLSALRNVRLSDGHPDDEDFPRAVRHRDRGSCSALVVPGIAETSSSVDIQQSSVKRLNGGSSAAVPAWWRYRAVVSPAAGKYGVDVSVAGAPGVSLIRTKVHGPIPRALVPRPALVERLVHGPTRRLTLVRGQAGWGKSSVLAAWSLEDPRPFAWLALDRGDNDPVRFFMYVIEALHVVADSVGEASAIDPSHPGCGHRRARLAGPDQRVGRAAGGLRVRARGLPRDRQRDDPRGGGVPPGPCSGNIWSW